MKKHSSAPWKRKEWSICNVYGDEICQILPCDSSGYTGNDTDEDEANANLIAAAPELLEALQTLVDLIHNDDWFGEWRTIAQEAIAKAIAKAKGEEQ